MTGPHHSGWLRFERLVNAELENLTAKNRLRSILNDNMVEGGGQPPQSLYDLSHNDYLALRQDQEFQNRAFRAAQDFPLGSGGSRLLGGNHPVFGMLEKEFAAFIRAPASLYFSSGYAANEAVASVLSFPDAHFFSDQLNHASMIDGMRLARLPKDRVTVFPHLNYNALRQELEQSPAQLKAIFVESLFSMDGDFADLTMLKHLADEHGAILVIDEAHSGGCFGPRGEGLAFQAGLLADQVIVVHTLGKAFGTAGAMVSGPSWFIDYLVNRARSFIFTTAPSPWVAAATREAVRYVAALGERRQRLARQSAQLRTMLTEEFSLPSLGASQIVPILCGSDAKALRLQERLSSQGIYAKAIRPPTVPENQARVRLSLHAESDDAQWHRVLDRIRQALHGI